MRLIWITPEFPNKNGNIKGIYLYRTAKELAKYYELYVICLYPAFPPILKMLKYWKDWKKIYRDWKKNYTENSFAFKDFKEEQIIFLRYFRFPRGQFLHIEGWFAYFQARKYLSKMLDRNTIIHANWIFPAGTMARIISDNYKVPFLISLMGSDVNSLIEGTKFWRAAKKLLQKSQMVTAVTEDLFDKCEEKHIQIEESQRELIDNIYESDNFIIKDKNLTRKDLGIDNNIKIIFYAGGLISLKNVDILIEAVSNIVHSTPNIHLFIAGEGTEEGKLKRMVESKEIVNSIFFLGPLDSNQMINYYNSADLFCLPSKSEGLPNVIVESFFCGTPVVASAVGGIPKIIRPGINGFLVKPNSVQDLEEKIIISLSHSWDRAIIRESISYLFPEKVIDKYHQIYNNLSKSFKDN
jgi:teichuronic acid biosynthesis glycosyltransferase TuaC